MLPETQEFENSQQPDDAAPEGTPLHDPNDPFVMAFQSVQRRSANQQEEGAEEEEKTDDEEVQPVITHEHVEKMAQAKANETPEIAAEEKKEPVTTAKETPEIAAEEKKEPVTTEPGSSAEIKDKTKDEKDTESTQQAKTNVTEPPKKKVLTQSFSKASQHHQMSMKFSSQMMKTQERKRRT